MYPRLGNPDLSLTQGSPNFCVRGPHKLLHNSSITQYLI